MSSLGPAPSGEINIFQDYAVEKRSPFDLEKLSDKLRQRASDWTIPEAYMALLMAATTADGQYDQRERDTLVNLVKRSRALGALSADVLRAAEQNVQQRAKSRPDWLQQACATLPSDMCLSLFAHCVDIILADGELLDVEARFLNDLVRMLDVPADHARRIMEVLLLKAQY